MVFVITGFNQHWFPEESGKLAHRDSDLYSKAMFFILTGDRGSDRSIRKSSLCPAGDMG